MYSESINFGQRAGDSSQMQPVAQENFLVWVVFFLGELKARLPASNTCLRTRCNDFP